MATPVLGLPELASGQAIPETTVNEQTRILEQGARWFVFLDRDLTAPPGSPADGDAYLVAASATGAWSGHDGEIAWRMSTAWEFITPSEGMAAYVADEDQPIVFDGTDWNEIGLSAGAGDTLVPVFNFTEDGEARFYAYEAMTLTEQATSGTGTIAYEKSTAAAPGTFSSTASPITLEAEAWLKVSASSVSSIFAVALKRTD